MLSFINAIRTLYFVTLIGAIVLVLLVGHSHTRINNEENVIVKEVVTNKECYKLNTDIEDIRFFEDISDSGYKPSVDRNIFFTETSCSRDGLIVLSPR